jgi:hypothetical protein
MTPYQCKKGCRDPKAKDGLTWHRSPNECPFETYSESLDPGRPGKMRAKGHPGVQKPSEQLVTPRAKISVGAPSGEGITFSDSKAQVTKGSSKPVEIVAVDYVVDGPHTKAFVNFLFRVGYFVHVKVDEWAFDWHKHLPKEQFQLTKNAEMSIEMDPRNFYSRGVTWVTKNIFQAKNLQQAHAAIDGVLFFEAFGGIGVALIFHYEEVYKNSPKLKKKREEAARRKAMKAGAIQMVQTGVTPEGVPIMTAATA